MPPPPPPLRSHAPPFCGPRLARLGARYDFDARPFAADAIIANPVCFGHIHVAEALGVSLHTMFPQPWAATRAYPHPMSGLRSHT